MKKTWATQYQEQPAGPEREIKAIGCILEIFTENNFNFKTKARMLAYLTSRLKSDERKARTESKHGSVE